MSRLPNKPMITIEQQPDGRSIIGIHPVADLSSNTSDVGKPSIEPSWDELHGFPTEAQQRAEAAHQRELERLGSKTFSRREGAPLASREEVNELLKNKILVIPGAIALGVFVLNLMDKL